MTDVAGELAAAARAALDIAGRAGVAESIVRDEIAALARETRRAA